MRKRFLRAVSLFAISILLVSLPVHSTAQGQNSVGGGANGANVNVTATVLGIPANVSVLTVAPATLPAQGGSDSNQVASANIGLGIAGVLNVLSTGVITDTTLGSIGQNSAHAESTSTVNGLNALGGLVSATTITSHATSDGNGSTATSSAAGTVFNNLHVAGIAEGSQIAPNTSINVNATIGAVVGGLPVNIPVTGTVILNEQVTGGNGTTTSSLTVNAIHIQVSGSVAGLITLNVNVIVASATSQVNFTATSVNHPPTLSLPGSQSVQVGNTLTFMASGSDADAGDTVTFTASNLPANANFTPNPATGNPASGQFTFTPTAAQAGQTFTVNFMATDNHGSSTPGSVQITVTAAPPTNHPPTLNVPGSQSVQVGNTLTFTVSANDPDAGDTITLSATGVPANATFNPATGQFTFTPTAAQAGQTFTVTFTATDNHGATANGSVQITVTAAPPTNHPPTLTVPSAQSVQAGSTLTFTVTASDPDSGDTITLSASSVPPNGNFTPTSGNPASGQFSFTPTAAQAGQTFTVSFTATDNHGATASGSVQITVTATTPTNHPPTINVPGAQTVQVGGTLTFTVTGSDPDAGDTITLSATGVPNHATFNPATGQFTFTPVASQAGQTFTVTFTATDNHGATITGTVQITVIAATPNNHPPVISLPGARTVQAGSTLTFTVTGTDPDAGDTVTLAATGLPPNATFTPTTGNPATGTFTFPTTTALAGQTFTVTFIGTDNHGATVSGTVVITISLTPPANHTPIISVPGAQIIEVGKTLNFTVTVSDPDGDSVTLTAGGLPPNAIFNPSTGTVTFTPAAAQVGQIFTSVFTAVDSRGASANASVQITVIPNQGGQPSPPVISVPPSPISVKIGDTLDFTVTASSPQAGCQVHLSTSELPANVTFDVSTGHFVFTPDSSQQDKSFIVTFTATDCNGLSSSATVIILVIPDDQGDTAAGKICIPVTKITFGPTEVGGGCGYAIISLSNPGAGTLKITALRFTDGSQFQVEGISGLPTALQSGGVLQLKIVFQPKHKGAIIDTLTIVTDDPTQPEMNIALKGKGKQ